MGRYLKWSVMAALLIVYLAAWTYGELGTFEGFPLAIPCWIFSICLFPISYDLMEHWKLWP